MNKLTVDVIANLLKMRIKDFELLLNNEEKEIQALKNLITNKEIQKCKIQRAIIDTEAHISKLKQT